MEIMTDPQWYSALNVIMHFRADLVPPFIQTKQTRKAEELNAAAIALVGIQQVQQRQYWIQPVSDKENSPDVRTLTCFDTPDDKAPDCAYQDVEVVSYEHSPNETLIEFLLHSRIICKNKDANE